MFLVPVRDIGMYHDRVGGLINYYHGESGLVVDRRYVVNDKQRAHTLRLRGNPHREFAFDYEGGDVRIDPVLKPGDRATFVRLDPYGGLWVREQDRLYPELQRAHDRIMSEIQRNSTPGVKVMRLHGIWAEQYVAEGTRRGSGVPLPNRPATRASFFLSFSSKNVMLARQIFEDLKYDAKVDVWFDLDQAGEAPEHLRRIETWLKGAIHDSLGFVLLWTRAANQSSWVRKEISWALERASRYPNFHFIVLKLDDEPVPDDISGTPYLVDCHDLWPVNGINEELFAAVGRRRGRTAWVEENRRRGVGLMVEEGEGSGYEPFRSDSGIAISLRTWDEGDVFCWQLDYEKDRRLHKAFGRGRDEAVDLGIRSGVQVGFFVLHRAPLVRFWPGRPLWMRSGDLSIKPEEVWARYAQRSETAGDRPGIPPFGPNIAGEDEQRWAARLVKVVDGDTLLMRPGDDS